MVTVTFFGTTTVAVLPLATSMTVLETLALLSVYVLPFSSWYFTLLANAKLNAGALLVLLGAAHAACGIGGTMESSRE